MTPERWKRIDEIVERALELAPEQRPAFLELACGGEADLRSEVESLIGYQQQASTFLQSPAIQEAAVLMADAQVAGIEGRTISHYQLTRQLGAGGMGEVYLADDLKLHRRVAIKFLPSESSADERANQRLIREAQAAAKLDHPNICSVHEVAEDEGRRFIVMQYVEGETLAERIHRQPYDLKESLDIAVQTADALAEAHSHGIIHRDIKPHNIMATGRGQVKVLDFGLAKIIPQREISDSKTQAESLMTQPGLIIGTVPYMSPEQARGLAVDARTDIWSLGCVLYEMVAGRAPFTGETVTDLLVAIVEREPPPLKDVTSEQFPAELGRIITKTLRKNPDERYQTSKELLIDLQRLRQKLEIESHVERSTPPEAGDKVVTANVADRSTATRTNRLRRTFSAPRGIIYAAVLIALMLGTLAYVSHWRQTSFAPRVEIQSLAVLPLKPLDAGENYLGLGITDAVIRRISQTGELIVRPTSAVRRYQSEEIDALTAAQQLKTDAVLEGSVQRSGERLRVSVNLLRASDGASLWANRFDMQMTDIFVIQDTVAQEVASNLRLHLDPSQQEQLKKRPTSNPIAYEYYMKGIYAFDQRVSRGKSQMEAAIDFFKQAINAEPDFALAHAQLAYVYAVKVSYYATTEPEWARRTEEEINQAEARDPQLAETHLARFQLLYSAYGKYQGEAAARELLLAQKLNPNVGHSELAYLYLHFGLEEFAGREIQRASEIDPTSGYLRQMIFLQYQTGNKYDEYGAQRNQYSEEYMDVWYFMGKGQLGEAQKAFDKWSANKSNNMGQSSAKALLLALKGDFPQAEAMVPLILSNHPVKDPIYHHETYNIARIYALEGKSSEAVKWLRETADSGWSSYPMFESDTYLNPIRQAPEFIQFMAEMKAQNERYRREFA